MSPRRAAALRDGGDQTLREHLIAAAARLIAEHGTAGLTVRGIAREAKVADGVLYNHFADKEELLAQALHAHVHQVMTTAGGLPAAGRGTVEDNLRAYITHGLEVLLRIMPAFAGLLHQRGVIHRFAAAHGPGQGGGGIRSALATYLRAEQALGRIDPEADVEAAATMIMGACHEQVLPRLFFGPPDTDLTVPPGFAEGLVTTVLRGIAPR